MVCVSTFSPTLSLIEHWYKLLVHTFRYYLTKVYLLHKFLFQIMKKEFVVTITFYSILEVREVTITVYRLKKSLPVKLKSRVPQAGSTSAACTNVNLKFSSLATPLFH